jgi:PAS domain S-box-containing protein
MFNIFKPPIFQDSEKTRKARVFFKLVWGFVIIITLSSIINIIVLPQNYIRWLVFFSIFSFFPLFFLILNSKSLIKLASGLYVLLILAVVVGMSWTAGGMRAPIIQAFSVIVLIAGLLLGWKKGIFIGIVASLLGLILVIAENYNILPNSSVVHTSFTFWVSNTIYIALIAFLQYLSVANLNNALQETKQELALRSKVEEALKRSETFRNQIFESSRIPIIVMDATTFSYIDCNQAAINIYGYSSKQEIIGNIPIQFSAPTQYDGTSSEEKAKYYIDRALTEGSIVFEWKHQRPNGEIWDAEVHLMSFMADNKHLLQFTLLDITERKLAEQKLRDSEARYRFISENTDDVIWLMNVKSGKFTFVSASVKKMRGYTPEEVMNQTMEEVLTPESLKLVTQSLQHSIANRKPGDTSLYKYINQVDQPCKDGSIVSTEVVTTIVFDQTGSPIEIVGVSRDITERKRAEQKLRDSEERFRLILENMPILLNAFDENGNIIVWNKACEEVTGYLAHEIIGNPKAMEMLYPDPQYREKVWNSSLNPKKLNNEFNLVTKNGEERTIVWFDTYHHLQISGWASWGMGQDVTELKKAEKELKDSEERYRKLVEAFPDMIMLSDLNKNILYANEPLEKITGLTPDDYRNPNRKAHIHPDDQKIVADAVRDLLNSDKSHTDVIENRFIDAWGNLHWFSGRMAKLYMNDQIVLQTVSRDITEKKALESELEKHRNHLESLVKERTDELAAANEELNTANEELQTTLNKLNEAQKQLIHSEKMASLGILSAGIAHEINNPLNFIHGGILGIEKYFKNNIEEHLEKVNPFINAINVGVKRTSDIVTSLSHYIRKNDLPYAECEIHSIIDNCLTILQNQLKNKVKIIKQYTDEPHYILGNEGKLHQGILNIIANAEQLIEREGTIEIKTEVVNNQLKISFTDSGIGISQENLLKVFDPFFTTKAPGKGTGLGLSITYDIIQEHKGTIEYESKIGMGTTAIIKIPIHKS